MGDLGTTQEVPKEDDGFKTMPLAIVGMSCRFGGGASNPEKLWDMLAEGRSAWSPVPKSRFNQDAFYHPDQLYPGMSHVKGGYFLDEDVAEFDSAFFNFPADVAAAMDPQIRIQLELTYEALENAGIPLSQIAGSNTSVFIGMFMHDYHDMLTRDPLTLPRFFITGVLPAMMANRISHFFDLRGPSAPVDTGCSASLTALHLACQSLRNNEANAAVVGGACLLLNPDMFSTLGGLGFVGPDGKCFAFDDRAQGYARGEGVATLVLKRLDDALRDGDPIRAIIRETAMNQDGKTPTITSPSVEAQETIIRACYERAGLNPLDTTYMEAHGTGTKAGDPIEAAAAGQVLGAGRPDHRPLLLGSVKTNVGHTEGASGLAAIIKVVKALENRQIPPSINFERLNPALKLDEWKLKVAESLVPWESGAVVRRASVNNFGYGGSNSHVIVEDAPVIPTLSRGNTSAESMVYVLSAKDELVLGEMRSNLQGYLDGGNDDLENIAYTLGTRRSRLDWTLAVAARSSNELCDILHDSAVKPVYSSLVPRVGFVFTGQGAQWNAMGRELMETYPVFLETLKEADATFREFGADWSAIDELTRDKQSSRVDLPLLSFPLSCLIQLGLVRLLRSWGISPSAVTGHSSGEVAAAYAAGGVSFREALAIVYFRGLLTARYVDEATTRGGMMAVGLGVDDVQPYLTRSDAGKVVVACINSPSSVTLSGDLAAVEQIEGILSAEGVFARRLKVQSAYHSHHMLALKDDYLAVLSEHIQGTRRFDGVTFFSPVTGTLTEDAEELGPEHWTENMLQPVLFEQCMRAMCENLDKSVDVLIELGPHGALAGPIRQCLAEPGLSGRGIAYSSCLARNQDAVQTTQNMAAFLVSRGFPVDLAPVNFPGGAAGLRVLTDLPAYPWNHRHRFWAESHVNREHRLRAHRPHDLLGVRMPGTPPEVAIWRHIIRPDFMPWVREHQIQTDIVYPAAGYLAMAIEGVRQLCQSEEGPIRGYELQEVEISRAVVVPDTPDGIEIQLSLATPDAGNLVPGLRSFQIHSATANGEWVEHCRGRVNVEHEKPSSQQPEEARLRSSTRLDLASSSAGYYRNIQPDDLFERLQAIDIRHGPLFQNLKFVRAGDDQSVAGFTVADTANTMPAQHQEPHVIHPVTLDAVFQGVYASLSADAREEAGAAVPRSIRKLYVSESIDRSVGHNFESFSRIQSFNTRGFTTSIAVVSSATGAPGAVPVLEVQDMHYQSLGSAATSGSGEIDPPLSMTIDWKEEWDLCDLERLRPRIMAVTHSRNQRAQEDLTKAAFFIACDTTEALTDKDKVRVEQSHPGFLHWLCQLQDDAASNRLTTRSSKWATASEGAREMLFDRVRSQSINGRLLCEVRTPLPAILRGESENRDSMFQDGLLAEFFESNLQLEPSIARCSEITKLLAHSNPRANILAIGASAMACTDTLLRVLTKDTMTAAAARFARYTVAHRSSQVVSKAKDQFKALGDLVTAQVLQLEKDPEEQGLELGSYDLVVATHVRHATDDLSRAMLHVRRLLKETGKLVLLETANNNVDVEMAFGALPPQWADNYYITTQVPEWQGLLQQAGFGGIDLRILDREDGPSVTVTVSTALPVEIRAQEGYQIALAHSDNSPPLPWMEELATALSKAGAASVTLEKISSLEPGEKHVVLLSNIDSQDIDLMEEEAFNCIQQLLLRSKGVLWVTRGGAIDCARPENALHSGLLRVCRVEDSSRRYISLDLDPDVEPWTSDNARIIAGVFQKAIGRNLPSDDFEYAVRAGSVMVPRLQYGFPPEEDSHPQPAGGAAELQPFHQDGRNLRMYVQTPGLLDSLVFKDNPEALDDLPEDFIEIEAQAFGLNFRDIMVAMDQLEETQMGFECGGIITRVGAGASHRFKTGDRVAVVMAHGHWTSHVRVPWFSAARIPDDLSFEMAATLPMVYITAYYSLMDVARLEEGESVLIHAASGGVGQAAIQLAKHTKARIFATVGSQEKRDFLTNTYGIPDSDIFSSRDVSFAKDLLAATGGRGVDVVLNSLAGPLLHETWNCLAPCGRFVEIGKKDIQGNKRLEMRPFQHAVSYTAVDLVHLADYRGSKVASVFDAVLDLYRQKAIAPVTPVAVYPISEVVRAFRKMATGKHMGKIVVKPNPEDRVKVTSAPSPVRLLADASYVLIGGLGGIGRSMTRWLIQHRAKNLILLSRSAASRPETQILIDEYAKLGCNVVVRNCDVASLQDLAKVLNACAKDLPPIRGVIQGAMLLADVLFESMTFDQWQRALQPKLLATRNLHEYFGTSLDFFITLSSVVGVIGNTGQANYAAGGSYQDALARYRSAQGLPAVSIDLGMVRSVGVVAENQTLSNQLLRSGHRPLEEEEVLQLLEEAIRNPRRTGPATQVVTGIAAEATSEQSWRQEPRFADLQKHVGLSSAAGAAEQGRDNLRQAVVQSTNDEEAQGLIADAVVGKLSTMFATEASSTTSMAKMGVDSLVAVELRNWLISRMQCEISIFDVLSSGSPFELAGKLLQRVL
ncbi:hypothetical protein BDW59DRAFT_159066 [Aspergillus cavernicola]|uniref:Polyketide synthase n=1 Tax=Aspergillus cavernicola TaxID=176166 RepID=A0ABR4INX5_9EURO